MSDTVTSLYVEEESTDELIKGLQSLRISDAHSSVSTNILSNCDNEDKSVNINSNNELLCSNVNNLQILQHFYTDSEDDSDSDDDEEEVFCNNPTENVQHISVSNNLLARGINALTKTMLTEELEQNGLSTEGTVKILKERLISAVNAVYPSFLDLRPSNCSVVRNSPLPDEARYHEANVIVTSCDKNSNAILNLECEIQALKNEFEKFKMHDHAESCISAEQENKKKIFSKFALQSTVNVLDMRVEELENGTSKFNEECQIFGEALVDLASQLDDYAKLSDVKDAYLSMEDRFNRITGDEPPFSQVTKSNKVDGSLYSSVTHRSDSISSEDPPQPQHNRRTNQHQRQNNRKKIVILRDSLLGKFVADDFSAAFQPVVYNCGSLKNLLENTGLFRSVYAEPNVDGYVITLGINDLREDDPSAVLYRMKKVVNKLLSTTSAKITISLLLPVHGRYQNMSNKIKEFNVILKEFINDYRINDNLGQRLFTIFNANFHKPAINDITHYFSDGLHLAEIGFKKFCFNLKLGF